MKSLRAFALSSALKYNSLVFLSFNSSEKSILLREQLDNLKEQKEELLLKYNQIKLAIEYVNML